MTMHKLGIEYEYLDHAWQRWVGEYPILETRIWDSARRLEQDMYRQRLDHQTMGITTGISSWLSLQTHN